MDAFDVIGVTDEMAKKFVERKTVKGRRDARVCVCGHSGGAHFRADGSDLDTGEGEIGCQAGKVPCACGEFKWVLTAPDVRSFIQKTEGPGPLHALTKGLASSRARGVVPTWREGIACFACKRSPEEVGALTPIAYNERWGEAFRSTPNNQMYCEECRMRASEFAASQGQS